MSGVYSQVIEEGYAAGEFYGYVCQGIDENGNYILKQGEDGQPVKEHLGSAMPKWNLGLSINMAYKDFDLTLAGYGMFGHKILNATKMELYDSTRLPAQNTLDDFLTSGVKQGAIFSDYLLESELFRMQTVTLGYNVPGVKKLDSARCASTSQLRTSLPLPAIQVWILRSIFLTTCSVALVSTVSSSITERARALLTLHVHVLSLSV